MIAGLRSRLLPFAIPSKPGLHDAALAAAVADNRSWHPYYVVRSENADGATDWRSVLTDEPLVGTELSDIDAQSASLRLARSVWDGPWRYLRTCRGDRLLAIANPLPNLATVAFEASERTVDPRFLEGCFEVFFRFVRSFEAGIALRPGFDVVLVGPPGGEGEELLSALRNAYQGALRQAGEGAPDLGVRWVIVPERAGDDLIEAIAAGHPPGPPWPRADEPLGWSAMAGELSRFVQVAEQIRKARPAAEDDHTVADLFEIGELMAEAPPILDTPGSPERSIEASAPPTLLLGARIAVRRWQQRPLTATFAPVTFLQSDNAHGKTTLAEALAQAFLDRPRVRLRLPRDAEVWDDRQGGRVPSSPPRIEGVRLVGATVMQQESAGSTLVLFGDDADLSRGEPGDVSFVAWWGLRGPTAGLRARLGEALLVWERLLRAWNAKDLRWVEPLRAGKVFVAQPAIRAVVADVVQRQREQLQEEAKSRNGAELEGLEKRIDILEQGEGLLPSGQLRQDVLDLVAQNLVAELGRQLPGLLLPAQWQDMRQIGSLLASGTAGGQALRSFAEGALDALVRDRQRWLDEVNVILGDAVTSPAVLDLERRLRGYFESGLVSLGPEAVRPNTARQVQYGQAVRLARWLAADGADFPATVVDEPTMSLDPANAAREIGRYIRLRRSAEAYRWLRFASRDAEPLAWRVVVDEWSPGVGGADRPPHRIVGSSLAIAVPMAPQLVMASYQSAALDAVAMVEGAELLSELRLALQCLIPGEWRTQIVDEVRETLERARKALAPVGFVSKVPACLVKLFWDDGWWERDLPRLTEGTAHLAVACKTLAEKLGLAALSRWVERASTGDADQVARRLIRWLLLNDLLPAALTAIEDECMLGGISVRAFPGSHGELRDVGGVLLERVSPVREMLPGLPVAAPTSAEFAEPARVDVPRETLPEPAPEPVAATGALAEPQTPSATSALAVAPVSLEEDRIWSVRIGDLPQGFGVADVQLAVRGAGMVPGTGDAGVKRVTVDVEAGAAPDGDAPHVVPWRLSATLPAVGYPVRRQVTGGLYTLTDELVAWRCDVARSGELVPGAPIEVAIATHIEDQNLSPDAAFLLSAIEPLAGPQWQGQLVESWRRRIEAPLLRLRTAFGRSPRTRVVQFAPRCHPGVALRVGAVFNASTGFTVACRQGGEQWLLEGVEEASAPLTLRDEGASERGEELHVLASISQNVEAAYSAWSADAAGASCRRRLAFERPGGASRSVASREAVLGWAAQVAAEVFPHRALPLRIFCAAPLGFAMALGRHLTTWPRVITMDLSPVRQEYFVSFDFRVA